MILQGAFMFPDTLDYTYLIDPILLGPLHTAHWGPRYQDCRRTITRTPWPLETQPRLYSHKNL